MCLSLGTQRGLGTAGVQGAVGTAPSPPLVVVLVSSNMWLDYWNVPVCLTREVLWRLEPATVVNLV